MAPKSSSSSKKRPPDPNGIFQRISVFLLPKSIQSRRLQVFKQKLEQMGATVEDHLSKKVTHAFAANTDALVKQLTNNELLKQFKGNVLLYEWLENCLKSGERLPEETYLLNMDLEKVDNPGEVRDTHHEPSNAKNSDDNSVSGENVKVDDKESKSSVYNKESSMHSDDKESSVQESDHHAPESSESDASQSSSLYKPPDLNRNITEIFGKLIDIYRALGDDRRSFSYYKAIPVIEKLPFKIESIDQVKHLPAIGKSMQDHIHEIVTTGRLSKLDHFEKDEMVRSVCLFGEVWGIGPATALKLYEKGHRTLDDLKNEESLTTSQKLGLKYFEDIKKRIPRSEVKDTEMLLQKAGQDILPGVIIVCGGSYRRGKATCGDMDIIITHPDGESHKGFLPIYVKYLKDINFLREDLIFSIHSTEVQWCKHGISHSISGVYSDLVKNNHTNKFPWFNRIWTNFSAAKNNFLLWKVLRGALHTMDRLQFLGLSTTSTCILCKQFSESVKHLFFECIFSGFIWGAILTTGNFHVKGRRNKEEWMLIYKSTRWRNERCNELNIALKKTVAQIWHERNERLFNNKIVPKEICLGQVKKSIIQAMESSTYAFNACDIDKWK